MYTDNSKSGPSERDMDLEGMKTLAPIFYISLLLYPEGSICGLCGTWSFSNHTVPKHMIFKVFLHLLLSNNGEVFNACGFDCGVEDFRFYIGILAQHSTHPPIVKTQSH